MSKVLFEKNNVTIFDAGDNVGDVYLNGTIKVAYDLTTGEKRGAGRFMSEYERGRCDEAVEEYRLTKPLSRPLNQKPPKPAPNTQQKTPGILTAKIGVATPIFSHKSGYM